MKAMLVPCLTSTVRKQSTSTFILPTVVDGGKTECGDVSRQGVWRGSVEGVWRECGEE